MQNKASIALLGDHYIQMWAHTVVYNMSCVFSKKEISHLYYRVVD